MIIDVDFQKKINFAHSKGQVIKTAFVRLENYFFRKDFDLQCKILRNNKLKNFLRENSLIFVIFFNHLRIREKSPYMKFFSFHVKINFLFPWR